MAIDAAQLSKEERATLKSALEKKLKEVTSEIDELESTLTQSEDDEKGAPDEVDRSSFEEEMQRTQLVLDGRKHLQYEISEAFKRMEEGLYGICEETEEAIGYKRLVAAPWTRLSIEAQQELEARRKNGPRASASAAYPSAYNNNNSNTEEAESVEEDD